jgi:hypothetical protein
VVGLLVPPVFAYHLEKLISCVSYPYRYCRLFDSVLHTNVITHNDAALHSGAGDDDNPTDPKLIIHVYHMVAAMDGVYEFISEYHEDWRTGLRSWLLRYCVRTLMRQQRFSSFRCVFFATVKLPGKQFVDVCVAPRSCLSAVQC